MTVCVLGMHRSGTSMVTRMLNVCGLYLGPPDDLMPAQAHDNPLGYWEHRSITQLNDDILATLGGRWDRPPATPDDWWKQPRFDRLRERASTLATALAQEGRWGWKDPRTCLTLPFWLDLLPDLEVVLCLRHPLEIAWSMSRGGDGRTLLTADTLSLWAAYNTELLRHVPGERVTTTHYASYFYDGETELRRVLDRLQMDVGEDLIERAVATITPDLRHACYPDLASSRSEVPAQILALWDTLTAGAGDVFERMLADDAYWQRHRAAHEQRLYRLLSDESDRTVSALLDRTAAHAVSNQLKQRVGELEGALSTLDADKTGLTATLDRLDEEKRRLVDTVARREGERDALTRAVERLDARRAEQDAKVASLTRSIERLREDNARLASRLERIEGENATLNRTARRLEHERVAAEAENRRLEDVTGRLEHDNQRLEDAQDALTESAARLEDEKHALMTEHAALTDSVKRLEHDRSAGEAEKASLVDRVNRLEQDELMLRAQRDHLQRERDAVHRTGIWRLARALQTRQHTSAGGIASRLLGWERSRSPVRIALDDPFQDGAQISATCRVAGWAVSDAGAIERVEAFLGDHLLGAVSYGVARPDLVAAFPHIGDAGRGGYEQLFDLAAPGPGPYDLVVRATDVVGNRQSVRRSVVLRAPVDPVSPPPMPSPTAAPPSEPPDRPRIDEPAPVPSSAPGTPIDRAFRAFLDEFQTRFGREPAVLDWNTGSALQERFPEIALFSPPTPGATASLPYADQSIDAVLYRPDEPLRDLEARRVAHGAVLTLPSASTASSPELVTTWQATTDRGRPLPSVSIIIPVYNHADDTRQVIEQLRRTLPDRFEGDVRVVDDASTDSTPDLLNTLSREWPALQITRNPENLGFVDSCNRGAELSTGTFLLFLNNDTLPQPGWFLPLLRTFEDHPDAGAVGAKLIYPNGTLQEAGGIVFSNGSGWNFGRDDPAVDHPLYCHVREVDYCSGAVLMTRRDLFDAVGRFDTRYRPAYYEDTDYCFAVRQRGFKVYYQCESVVVHVEGTSMGTDITASGKRHQAINRAKFVEKWHDTLVHQPAPPDDTKLATRFKLVVRDAPLQDAVGDQ